MLGIKVELRVDTTAKCRQAICLASPELPVYSLFSNEEKVEVQLETKEEGLRGWDPSAEGDSDFADPSSEDDAVYPLLSVNHPTLRMPTTIRALVIQLPVMYCPHIW